MSNMETDRKTLMVVGDDLANLRMAKNALSDFYPSAPRAPRAHKIPSGPLK